MRRERALKVVLLLVGLLFCAAVYPLILMVKQDPALATHAGGRPTSPAQL